MLWIKTQAILTGTSVLALTAATLAAQAAACPSVADPLGMTGEYPGQLEVSDWAGDALAYTGNPLFDDEVAAGKLPPVEERLPDEPLIVLPYQECGRYGGTLHGAARAPESGTSEILSWRQVNLVRMDDDMETIKPDVPSAWEWGENYRSITFRLRKGHKWSDGVPFTADDVIFFLDDIIRNPDLNPETPAPWVVGGEQVTIEKIDDQIFTLHFAAPNPGFLYYLATSGSYFAPYAPKHYYEQFHAAYNPNAETEAREAGFNGWVDRFGKIYHKWKDAETLTEHALTRPTLESHVISDAADTQGRRFVANPYYFKIDSSGQQLPYIDRHDERYLTKELTQLAVLNGEIDQKTQGVSLSDFPVLKENEEQGGYVITMPAGGSGPYIAFDMTHGNAKLAELYSDTRFRDAMSYAIDRGELNETLFFDLGQPQQAVPLGTSFVTDEQRGYRIEHDPGKANALLDEIGMKKGPEGFRTLPDGTPYTLLWEYSSQFANPGFVRLMLDYFKAVGIRVNPKEMTTEATRQNAKQDSSDINMEWDVPFEPTLIADVSLYTPPYSEISPLFGLDWRKWVDTEGTEGTEPPAWVMRLYDLAAEFQTLEPGSDRYAEIGREMVDINQEHMTIIGTIGEVPRPTVVNTKLGNIPEFGLINFNYGYQFPFRTDQWFFRTE
jgi:peptide/nickel transport system substrate-binding protein